MSTIVQELETVQEFNTKFLMARMADNDRSMQAKESLKTDSSIRAITVCFSNIEGKLHLIDYDKYFLLNADDNLTFDGSSIRGFTTQNESDLRLSIDWETIYRLPEAMGGKTKALVFASILNQDNTPYDSDIRAKLKLLRNDLKKQGITVNAAAEIEGFLFKGLDAERKFEHDESLVPVTSGGYYDTMMGDDLREFIDKLAICIRHLGFRNEKDHPEVGPSQFELNWGYTDFLVAADQIQLYKLCARHVARQMGHTASFLPKPIVGINGSGMHTNISMSKEGKNLFAGKESLSDMGDQFALGILNHANDLSLVLNSSVNSYRRLDPNYEAPNTISYSKCDRSSMIRVPLANEKSARIEVRAISPDANPYLVLYSLVKAGLYLQANNSSNKNHYISSIQKEVTKRNKLPDNIYNAISYFSGSSFVRSILGEHCYQAYAAWKVKSANRCPKELGKHIKKGEILYHHEVYNQSIWSNF